MAIRFLAPDSASVFDSSACVVGSEGKYLWCGFSSDTGGSLAIFQSGSATAGRELLVLYAAACSTTAQFGPLSVGGSGVYLDIDVGSAMVALA